MENRRKPLLRHGLFSTAVCGRTLPFFHRERRHFLIPSLSLWNPQSLVEKWGQRLGLMLVVISFTTSAKAGSVRICFSTLSSECSTVV